MFVRKERNVGHHLPVHSMLIMVNILFTNNNNNEKTREKSVSVSGRPRVTYIWPNRYIWERRRLSNAYRFPITIVPNAIGMSCCSLFFCVSSMRAFGSLVKLAQAIGSIWCETMWQWARLPAKTTRPNEMGRTLKNCEYNLSDEKNKYKKQHIVIRRMALDLLDGQRRTAATTTWRPKRNKHRRSVVGCFFLFDMFVMRRRMIAYRRMKDKKAKIHKQQLNNTSNFVGIFQCHRYPTIPAPPPSLNIY